MGLYYVNYIRINLIKMYCINYWSAERFLYLFPFVVDTVPYVNKKAIFGLLVDIYFQYYKWEFQIELYLLGIDSILCHLVTLILLVLVVCSLDHSERAFRLL